MASAHHPTKTRRNKNEAGEVSELPTNFNNHRLGGIVGSTTGETEHDIIAGGWEGTDDATSTAPSDLSQPNRKDAFWDPEAAEDALTERAFGGGPGVGAGICDITGMQVEGSHDWIDDPITPDAASVER